MVNYCGKCINFYTEKKHTPSIDEHVKTVKQPSDFTTFHCRKNHDISKSVNGWVRLTTYYTCDDFIQK